MIRYDTVSGSVIILLRRAVKNNMGESGVQHNNQEQAIHFFSSISATLVGDLHQPLSYTKCATCAQYSKQ